MSDQVHRGFIFTCAAGVNDNDTIIELQEDARHYDTWILGSTAGAVDVFVSLDGTNYLATALALRDLTSTTPATMVINTTAGGAFAFTGKFGRIKVMQKGATAVANPSLIGYRTT